MILSLFLYDQTYDIENYRNEVISGSKAGPGM